VDLQAIFYHRLLQMLSPFGLSLQLLSRYSVCSWSLSSTQDRPTCRRKEAGSPFRVENNYREPQTASEGLKNESHQPRSMLNATIKD
jgi:hypothetical protein